MTARCVLIVDDSELARDVAREALTVAGYDVRCAGDLAELHQAVADGRPELVLMDVRMPEAFGDDVGMVLRERGIRAAIVLYSSLPAAELGARAREAGVDGWLRKQDGTEALVAKVAAVLEAR
jgi:two-component system alkaline phosphatase synthesis response regulator PhoP